MTSLSNFFGAQPQVQEEKPWTSPTSARGWSRPSALPSTRPRRIGGGSPSSNFGDYSEFSEIERATAMIAGRSGQAVAPS
eukprot:4246937-Heterocapsa_arctica.AAC.1